MLSLCEGCHLGGDCEMSLYEGCRLGGDCEMSLYEGCRLGGEASSWALVIRLWGDSCLGFLSSLRCGLLVSVLGYSWGCLWRDCDLCVCDMCGSVCRFLWLFTPVVARGGSLLRQPPWPW